MANVINIPYEKRAYLTVKEAAAYFRLGETKIREMTDGNTIILITNTAATGNSLHNNITEEL